MMFYTAIILGAIAVMARQSLKIRAGAAAGALLCLLLSALAIVPPGHAGVPILFGSVGSAALPEGLNLINPLSRIEILSVRTETYTMNAAAGDDSIGALSADGVSMPMDVSLAYRLVPGDAPWVFQNLGRQYIETILRPAVRAAVPEAVARFSFHDAYIKRDELAQRIRGNVTARIQGVLAQYGYRGSGIVVQEVFLRKIQLPANLKEAIEQKMRSEQEAARMTYVLQKEEREAERKRIEAKGIRDFQAIVTEGISDKLLQWKGIEATEMLAKSPNAKLIVVGSGKNGLPVILNPGS